MHERERLRLLELEQIAGDHLSRLNGALELQAATLALLLPPGNERSGSVWQIETAGTANAATVREHVSHLTPPARLPWLEALVSRMRGQSIDARQTLLEATRRLMGARRAVHPIDRLHWLAMRQWLGEGTAARARAPASADLTLLPQADVSAIASYTAFLSRLIPIDAIASAETAEAAEAAGSGAVAPSTSVAADATQALSTPGTAWYDSVMQPWQAHATVEPCRPPDTDGFVHALQNLQAMAWMQRPTLIRGWLTAAQEHSRHHRLGDIAADALRLSCSLLDSPMPPELARHYSAVAPATPR